MPRIDVSPTGCFTVNDYVILDDSGKTPDYVHVDLLTDTLSIQISDVTLTGQTVHLTLKAVLNDSLKTQLDFNGSNKVVIEIFSSVNTNSCSETKLIPSSIANIFAEVGQQIQVIFKEFSDTVSKD